MATDSFRGVSIANKSQPYTKGAAVTPNDGVDLTFTTRAVWVGGAGNLTVTMSGGGDVTFTGVTAGALLHIRASRVKATGTSATNIVALW